jgi:hypothetical protein
LEQVEHRSHDSQVLSPTQNSDFMLLFLESAPMNEFWIEKVDETHLIAEGSSAELMPLV